jgi:hypothetical protein
MTAKVFETAAQKWSAQMAKTTEKANQGLSGRSAQHAFQQARLQDSRTLLVSNHIQHSVAAHRQLYLPNSGSVCRRRVK